MKIVRTLSRLLTKVETVLVVILLGIMLLLGFTQVILRNIFHSGILWGDILLRHLVLWLGFLGALLATSTGKHISIDAFTRYFPSRVKYGINCLTDFFAMIVCYFLFRAALTFIGFEISDSHMVYAEIPAWYAESIIPLGYGLLAVHFFLRCMEHINALLKGEASE